jgi:hypothetical protein
MYNATRTHRLPNLPAHRRQTTMLWSVRRTVSPSFASQSHLAVTPSFNQKAADCSIINSDSVNVKLIRSAERNFCSELMQHGIFEHRYFRNLVPGFESVQIVFSYQPKLHYTIGSIFGLSDLGNVSGLA